MGGKSRRRSPDSARFGTRLDSAPLAVRRPITSLAGRDPMTFVPLDVRFNLSFRPISALRIAPSSESDRNRRSRATRTYVYVAGRRCADCFRFFRPDGIWKPGRSIHDRTGKLNPRRQLETRESFKLPSFSGNRAPGDSNFELFVSRAFRVRRELPPESHKHELFRESIAYRSRDNRARNIGLKFESFPRFPRKNYTIAARSKVKIQPLNALGMRQTYIPDLERKREESLINCRNRC